MSAATRFDDYVPCGGIRYRLGRTLRWEIGKEGSGWLLVVPQGFVFDSSVPRFLRWLISPHHRPWLLAAAVHDRLLLEGHDWAFAAGEWYRAARALEPRSWKVPLAYLFVAAWAVLRRHA